MSPLHPPVDETVVNGTTVPRAELRLAPVTTMLPRPRVRRGRSQQLSRQRRLMALIPLGAFVSYVVWANMGWAQRDVWALIAFYSTVATVTFTIMVSGLKWRSFAHLEPAEGTVLVIVPVYNEDPAHVRETVLALATQSIRPTEIHVIDDGSAVPLEPFPIPGVFWHRQPNAGKREAQATVLREVADQHWDFILTVDSDSVPDPDALEHLLRSMSDHRVMAATGMIFVRNWRDNLLTRLVDINVVSSCLMFRMIRSWFGVVTPTSGALALYRAELLYDNLEDYLSSGTAGDDRRLSFYGLLKGHVVGVSEAVVETHLPTTIAGTFHQRLRWSKSAWLGIPFVTTNLRPLALFFYLYPLVFALLWPFIVALLTTLWIQYGVPGLMYGFFYWTVVAITMTAIYALYRPDLTTRERWSLWALSPIYPALGVIVLRPAAYWALTKLRSTSWHTRESPTGG
ncbi:MAG: glycosyltransferase [Nocardioides sp.]|nr:glycosyltransferase [Nocardioides sp.]